jgi:hypothetical protein
MYTASICFVSHHGCDGLIPIVVYAWRETPKTKDLSRQARGEIKIRRGRSEPPRLNDDQPFEPPQPDFAE